MPADSPLVHLERRDDGVAVVRLDNPKVNALSTEVLRQIEAVAGELTADPPGAVVVTGGDRLFAAGADIGEFGGPDEARQVGGAFVRAHDAVAAIPRCVIAAVSGFALGGGCELALACDLRIASEKARFGQPEVLLGVIPGGGGTQRLARLVGGAFVRAHDAVAAIPRCVIAAVSGFALGGGCELALACDLRIASEKARFGQPEVLLGVIPGGGGTQRLARLVGPSRAKDLILTGRQVRADEALRIGLVDEVVAHDELHDRALALAAELARGAVVAHGLAKRAIDEGLRGTLASGIALEQELFAQAFDTEDARIGVASFLEHGPGKASFTGR